jgi:rod shape-determining protein MreC
MPRSGRPRSHDGFNPVNNSAYLLAVAGILSALILLCLLLPDEVTQPLRHGALAIFGPVISTVEKPVHYFGRVDSKLRTLDEAQRELRELRARVGLLEAENATLSNMKADNARLREMLGFREASQYLLLPCRVISREPSNWWDSVQVNVGDINNNELYQKYGGKYTLGPDEPVVSPRGVVGKTGTVSQSVTDVILMVNENCSISAYVDGTHDQCIVQGQGNFDQGQPSVRVKYLPKNSQVAVGQFIVTSGLGPYFPAGLRLGTVTNVPPLDNAYPTFGLYREATIEPTADLNQLDELFVVLGSKPEANTETKPDTNADAGSDTTNSAPPPTDSTPPTQPTGN